MRKMDPKHMFFCAVCLVQKQIISSVPLYWARGIDEDTQYLTCLGSVHLR